MTEKELKGLSRSDLLELLIAQTAKCEVLEAQLSEAQRTLQAREIMIANAGSLAEAAMQMNSVFQAADKAAAQYLTNVMRMCREQEEKCASLERDYVQRSQELLGATMQKCHALEQDTNARCEEMLRKAEAESQAYWTNVHSKLEQYCTTHESLMALLKAKG